MEYEVIVVGGGIGGLTTAALLAARGVSVCLFERQSQVGGCVANFVHLGYTFEPTFGLYSGWEPGGTWDQVFSSLPVSPPNVTKLSPNYVVRLGRGEDVAVSADRDKLEAAIASTFPDGAAAAINFLRNAITGTAEGTSPAESLQHTSKEFREFINAQLQMFAQRTSDNSSWVQVTAALRMATADLWSIDGGAQTLAERLAESFKASGGTLRLNAPALRFAFRADGTPNGVDLLNGERVIAKRALVSNLTVWDTFGKLIGPSRTPRQVASELKKLSGWGAFLMFLSLDESATEALPAPRTLLVCEAEDSYDPEQQQLSLNLMSGSRALQPAGKRALTAISFAQADDWFSFHEDHSWHEEKDQAAMETAWAKLYQAMPQLGDSLEVIETSTPQTVYESTRRRFGMFGPPRGIGNPEDFARPFPDVFLVGDTVSHGLGLEGTAESGVRIARQVLAR